MRRWDRRCATRAFAPAAWDAGLRAFGLDQDSLDIGRGKGRLLALQKRLASLRFLDPACGSGAFLIAAFEALEPAYLECNEAVQSITGTFDLFDSDKDILTGNLYGVDLNAESIEITMLSLWLKTAKRGKKLENLGHTLKVGNSIIGKDSEHKQGRGMDRKGRAQMAVRVYLGSVETKLGSPAPNDESLHVRGKDPSFHESPQDSQLCHNLLI